MMNKILIFTFSFVCAFSAPVALQAADMEWRVTEQMEDSNINITVNQSTLNITGAAGLVLEVVSLTGRPVAMVKIESPAQRVELNIPKGCYILKIGKVVRKVSIC